MKPVGKKNLDQGRNITTMFMIYLLVLVVVIAFLISSKTHMLFWSTVLALSLLVLERLIAIIRFKLLPNDLIIMHRDHIEIKSRKESKNIKYKEIKDIEVSKRMNKFYILTIYNTKIFVKYLDKPNEVKKEILDYKNRYY